MTKLLAPIRLMVVGLMLLLAPALQAQDSVPPADTASLELPRDSAGAPVGYVAQHDSLGRPIIVRINIVRSDIFDSSEAKGWLARVVNGLHVTSAEYVVRRELLFKEGEPYDSAKVAETLRNLRRVSVFRNVRIDTATGRKGLVATVVTQDGWTTQLDGRFRSTGNQTDWQIALIEKNLLGTATKLAGRYRHTPDRNMWNLQFLQPRLFAQSVSLGLRYESRSDGDRGQVAIDRPFFALSDKKGIYTLFDVRNERVLQFTNGASAASDSLRRSFMMGRVEAATALSANTEGYLHVGVTAQFRRDDYAPWPAKLTETNYTATFGPFIEWRKANYVVTRGFLRYGRDEDVDVSNYARLGAWIAPKAFGYDDGGVGLLGQLRLGTQVSRGFAWVDLRANGLITGAGIDSGSVVMGATAVMVPSRRHMVIGHADIGWIKDPVPAQEFDLGFASGPRAFPIHAYTGDRTYFATAEYRFLVAEDLIKLLDLGLATFADHGGAWWHYDSRRRGTDVGIGLRLSASRAADANPSRLDLAYRFDDGVHKAGWVFVVSSGLVFNTNPRGGF